MLAHDVTVNRHKPDCPGFVRDPAHTAPLESRAKPVTVPVASAKFLILPFLTKLEPPKRQPIPDGFPTFR